MKNLLLISCLVFIVSCKKENKQKTSEHFTIKDSLNSHEFSDSLSLKNNLGSVDDIKREYNFVNSQLLAKKLDSVKFDYQCEERTGNVVYYSEKGVLKMIKHFNADSHYSTVENYFVNNGKPYFIFKDETLWSFDGGTPEKPETKDDITEKRFYIVEYRPIQCLEKKYTLQSSAKNNPKSENVLSKEIKNCSIYEVQKTFNLLMKNKDSKGDIKCL
ncbi:hypothetical protein HIO71_00415 [Chryseobacterium aquaticum]|uniref:Lipoprotein n=1 Tax=Chryseobacterium aquaticum TaxID=452084 RepID=A0A848N1U4_9FLAO|nr:MULTISPECIES: hypothetical protein [Chryseobacterium]NMR32660.1 hypothetical protein [Chryseobacterium aquaticum]NRQ45410.1 hypothetical protein [Chryseobacterium sp. C-204]